MEIRKLFGQQEAVKTATQTKRDEVELNQGSGQQTASAAGEDIVSLSRLSRQLVQVSDIVDQDGQKRAERVRELKKSIDEGSYSVSSSDVARSLVSYASDQPPLREI